MNLMLKRGIEVLMGVALAAILFAVLPAVAEAQSRAATQEARSAERDAAAASVVVRPSDSLWSISSERLGPNATPQQIANTVERIYALNRNQIGADPNLILPGPSLLLPPVAERAVERRGTPKAVSTTVKKAAAKPAQASTQRSAAHKAAKPSSAAASVEAEPVALPGLPAKEEVPEVDSLPAKESHASPGESFMMSVRSFVSFVASTASGALGGDGYLERRLLGLAILALSFGAALLPAWRWYARRQTDRRLARQAHGINNYNFFDPLDPSAGLAHVPKPPPGAPGRSRGDFADRTAGGEQAPGYVIISAATRKRRERIRRERSLRSARPSSGSLSLEVHNPEIRRSLRHAHRAARPSTTRGRRPRRVASTPKEAVKQNRRRGGS